MIVTRKTGEGDPMQDTPSPGTPEGPPGNLVFLRRLVVVLTASMIIGIVTITALLVIRLQSPIPLLPETMELPDGVAATAFTVTPDWYAVVTDDNRILIFDRQSGTLRQTIHIAP